jgi:glycosyltransferase involved in cell wall biosynthesis
MRIRYAAYALDSTGYGEFSRYIIAALHAAGHEISVATLHDRTERGDRLGPKGILTESLIGKYLSGPPDVNIVNALAQSFEKFRIQGALNIGFTMYESETIPESDVSSCNRMDKLFVPSALNARAYHRAGVTIPISIIHPGMELPEPASPTGPYTFFSTFEWFHPHKDPVSLLTAYYQEFQPEEPVLLRVKTFDREKEVEVIQQIEAVKARLGLKYTPRLELIIGSVTTEEMWAHYRQSSCYVSSHHGEGWGLPIWEAMASGLPAIATGYGANMEFMHCGPQNSYPVGYSYRRDKWADVDIRDLRWHMRRVYEHQYEASLVAKNARATIQHRFTPARSATMIERAL